MLAIITSVLSAVGPVLSAVSKIGLTIEGLKGLGQALMAIGKALGIIKTEKTEQLGDRALQAEEMGIRPEDYDSHSEWVAKIESDDWGYDPEKNKDMDPATKIQKGLEVAVGVMIDKFPKFDLTNFVLNVANNKEFFNENRMDEIGKLAAEDGDSFEKILNYLDNSSVSTDELDAGLDILMNISKTLDPTISDNDAYKQIVSVQKNN